MSACKWAGQGNPRILPGRHAEGCSGAPCEGCLLCPDPHCAVCRRAHSDGTCPECLAATRDDLLSIAAMCHALPAEAVTKGVNSEAAMLWGPTADPEAWRNRATAAMFGRLDDAYLEDCRDEAHPLWVLGTWEQVWRDHLDQPTDLGATLPRLVDYLGRQMHVMAADAEVPFEDFARDLRRCRAHLESVLSDGEQRETGAPCPKCGKVLVKRYGRTEAFDHWVCPNKRECGEWYTAHEYAKYVTDDYLANADALTAPDMAKQYDVPAGSVRGWATLRDGEDRPRVRKRGKDHSGRQLYDVADTLAMKAKRDKSGQDAVA